MNRPQDMRVDYDRAELRDEDAGTDPAALFRRWFEEACAAKLVEPNAMTLATADAAGRPSARIVLLKDYGADGYTFYTNYESRKGEELAANPLAALLFWWDVLHRQVRIEGTVEKVSAADSDAYYRVRPLGSRWGAWASAQSRPVSRARLELQAKEAEARLGDDPPRPPFWGGYRLVPTVMEFWQGRQSRLHDRVRFRRATPDAAWERDRLSP